VYCGAGTHRGEKGGRGLLETLLRSCALSPTVSEGAEIRELSMAEPDQENPASDEEAGEVLSAACRQLVGDGPAEAFAVQIRRVLCHLLPEDDLRSIRRPDEIIAVYRSRQLIPRCLSDAFLAAAADDPYPERAAVCFASCIYPRRAYHMEKKILRERVQAFPDVFNMVDDPFEVLSRSPGPVPAEDLADLADDLSAVDCGIGEAEQQERRNGSAFYLLTCSPEERARTHRNWLDDGAFVRAFRKWCTNPPSSLTQSDDSAGEPDWSRVTAKLITKTGMDADHAQRAVVLEKQARRRAGDWVHWRAVPMEVITFWNRAHNLLWCGFPYHYFRSHFEGWWGSQLEHYRFTRDLVIQPAAPDGQAFVLRRARPDDGKSDYYGVDLTPEQMRWFREGYRLVRATFFRGAGKTAKHAPAARDTDDGEIVRQNEFVRSIVDDIFYKRLERRMTEEDGLTPESIKNILKRHPEAVQPDLTEIPDEWLEALGTKAGEKQVDRDHLRALKAAERWIHTLCRRVRLRMWAYSLSRLRGLRNAQILSVRRPGRSEKHPLAKEPAVLAIASIARAVPSADSLIWAFTSHVFLHPKVEPQRPDPWSFTRWVQEIWHWVTEETFDDAIRHGVRKGHPADQKAKRLIREDFFRQMLEDLRRLESREEAGEYAAGLDLQEGETLAGKAVSDLVGGRGLHVCDDRCLTYWRRLRVNHWILPVWYLTSVEQMDPEGTLARLKVDRDEESRVRSLCAAISRCRECTLPVTTES